MKVAALQLDIVWEDREANYRKVRQYVRDAQNDGAQLIVLPEMFATGFSMNPSVTAEPSRGATSEFLKNLAVENDVAIVGGMVEQVAGNKGCNVALAFNSGGELMARYAKTHLFSHALEEQHHLAGDGPVTFRVGELRCALHICYDLRFPELFRKTADECHLHIVIASWPAARQRHWDLLLPARAIENQLYVLGVNRVGSGGGLDYNGGSVLYSPVGDCLAFGGDDEKLIVHDVDAEAVDAARKAFPALGDRRF